MPRSTLPNYVNVFRDFLQKRCRVWTGNPAPGGGGIPGPAPVDYNDGGKLDFAYYNSEPWNFFNANSSLQKPIATGGVASHLAMLRRQLP